MSENYEYLKPVGGRYVQKNPCARCEGKGIIIKVPKPDVKCDHCKGVGWVIKDTNDPVVCPECKGHRVIREIHVKCEECKGIGFHVQLMQDFQLGPLCPDCEGKGTVECKSCEGTRYVICPKCYNACGQEGNDSDDEEFDETNPEESRLISCKKCKGSGRIFEISPEIISLKDWQVSQLRDLVERRFGSEWHLDMFDDDKLLLDDFQFLQVVRCRKCLQLPEWSHCFLCNDRKIIRIKHFAPKDCENCEGSGWVDRPPACETCQGYGYIRCPDCFVEDEDEDGDDIQAAKEFCCVRCSGSGAIHEIVARPV